MVIEVYHIFPCNIYLAADLQIPWDHMKQILKNALTFDDILDKY